MPIITSTYSAPAPIPFEKPNIQSSDVNNTQASQDTFLATIADQRALGVITSNTTLVANRDIYNPVSTAGGAVTITLPSGANHTTQPIFIKKISNDLTAITIQRASTDVIESPFVPLTTPTATSITLVLPNESIALYPTLVGGVHQWRVVSYSGETKSVYARAFRNATQSIANAGFIKVQFNAETSDVYNLYDPTTNHRFTCPVAGVYEVSASVAIGPTAGSSDMVASIYKNGSEIARGSRVTNTGAINSIVLGLYVPAVVNDYFEIFVFNAGVVKTAEAGSGSTYGVFSLKYR